MSKKLNEGLRLGDLEGMVLPMLTIDEFSSKIDDNKMIVVGFYCQEEDPAHDLSNFIERSPATVQDTDVSPAPSKEGYYLTFAEIARNEQFPEHLEKLLQDVSRLTNIQQWQFTSIKLPKAKLELVTPSNIRKYVDCKQRSNKPQHKVQEWLAESSLSDVQMLDTHLQLIREGVEWNLEFVGLGQARVPSVISFDETVNNLALRLERLLEGGYSVHAMGKNLIIEHPHESTLLTVRVHSI